MESASFTNIHQCVLVLFCHWKERFTEDDAAAAASCCVFQYFIFYSIWGGSSKATSEELNVCSIFFMEGGKWSSCFSSPDTCEEQNDIIKAQVLLSILYLGMVMPGAGAEMIPHRWSLLLHSTKGCENPSGGLIGVLINTNVSMNALLLPEDSAH